MKPVFFVLDMAHEIDPFQTSVRTVAQEYFSEHKQDGRDVRMVAYYDDERPEDLTPDAIELAAKDWLETMGDFDCPKWVKDTPAYDEWLEQEARHAVEARRQYEHERALRANL